MLPVLAAGALCCWQRLQLYVCQTILCPAQSRAEEELTYVRCHDILKLQLEPAIKTLQQWEMSPLPVSPPQNPSVCCRKINTAQPARKKEAVAYFSIESAIALVISLFINICVVAVFARGFFGKGIEDIGLQNAGEYLGTAFGKHMVRTASDQHGSLAAALNILEHSQKHFANNKASNIDMLGPLCWDRGAAACSQSNCRPCQHRAASTASRRHLRSWEYAQSA